MNRSMNSLKNVITGLFSKFLLMFIAFFVRTLFIKYLGAEYAGLNSLFINILSVLSLAEFGIGTVLMYSLYDALNEKNDEKISKLVSEFKVLYKKIIIIILIFGIIVMLFIPLFVNTTIETYKVNIYYILYLINSVSTYFVIYRTTVINADQKNYIINICTTITTIAMYILQIVSLIIFKSFLIYLIIQIVCNITNNIVLNQIAIKQYPYLKKLDNNKNQTNRNELYSGIKATFIYKISDTILDQTDSIIISIMIGTVYVGYYSNYFLIVTYLVNIAAIIANGLLASFGSLNAENNEKKSYEMFKVSMFMFATFGIVCSVCYICSIQDFIKIWIGEKYILDYDVIIAAIAVFYLRMVTNSMWMYRTSMGLFKEVKYASMMAAILNIILSIMLGKIFGMAGIIIATAISRLLTTFWYEGKVLYNRFKVDAKEYFKYQLKNFIILLFILIISFEVCKYMNLITENCLLLFMIKNIICIFISLFVITIMYHKTNEYKIFIQKFKNTTLLISQKRKNLYERK